MGDLTGASFPYKPGPPSCSYSILVLQILAMIFSSKETLDRLYEGEGHQEGFGMYRWIEGSTHDN